MAEHPPGRAVADILVSRWRTGGGLGDAAAPSTDTQGDAGLPQRLSFAQEGLWIAESVRRKGQTNIGFAGVVEASLDLDILASVVERIGDRHPVLTAGVDATSGVPRQVLTEGARLRLEVVEVVPNGAAAAWQDAGLARLAQLATAEPFDLERGPLARVRTIRLSPAHYLLVVAAHHVAIDGWSMAAVLDELATAYNTLMGAAITTTVPRPRALDGLAAVRFGNFATAQREEQAAGWWQAGVAYWRERLRDLDGAQLPRDYPAPSGPGADTGWREVTLSSELSGGLRALARSERTTLFTVLLASLQLALRRWTGQRDIVIGCPSANRRAGMYGTVGLVANLLLMRAEFADDWSFRQLVGQASGTVSEALAHANVPFEHLVRELRLPGAGVSGELFPLGFTWESWPIPVLELGGVPMRRIDFGVGRPLHPIELYLRDDGGVIRGRVEFDRARVNPAVVTQLISCWQHLTGGALAAMDRPGSTLPFVSLADVRRQAAWSGRSTPAPDVTVTEQFASWAAATPDAVAVTAAGVTLTYGELHAKTDRLARNLRRLGMGPGSVVATLLPRSPELVSAMLAVLKAGAAYLPLDPALPEEYLRSRLTGAGVALAIADRLEGSLLGVPFIGVDDDISPLPARGGAASDGAQETGDIAYVIYTSGSTGTPKPVAITHRSLANLCTWHRRAYRVRPQDRASQAASPAFDAAGWEIWPYLSAGASVHVMPDVVRADPGAIVAWLAATEITVCFLPTPLAELVLSEPGPITSLRLLLTGGDRLTMHRPPGSSFQLVNNYGPTESTVVATWEVVPDDGEELGPPTIGRPIDNCLVRVRDENRQPVPDGAPGELYIGGAGLAAGYLGQPELTSQSFVVDDDGTRLYRTGDRARLREDGRLEFLGRLDRQVKVRGIRIEPAEVEALLARHPSVAQAVVDALDNRLVAWVVPRPAHTITGNELSQWLVQRGPGHLIPTQWVLLAELPVTANGKRDRSALAAAAQRPASQDGDGRALDPVQGALAETWCAALSLAGLGLDDDFFELGGDSLAAMRIVSLARRRGLALRAEDVLRHATIRRLAAVTETAPAFEADAEHGDAGANADGSVPLMPCQQELLARSWMCPHRWDQCVLLEVDEVLDPGLLAEVAIMLTDRHDSLRLRLVRTEDGWQQTVRPPGSSYGTIVHALDLSDRSAGERVQVLSDTAAALQDARDLAFGPLLSLVSADCGPGQAGYLLTCIHHLAVDALSIWIFLNDLLAAYRQLRDGRPVDLPSPTTPYTAWARLVTGVADTPRVRDQQAYWQEQCRPGVAIRYDHDMGALTTGSNERRSLVLDVGRTRRLVATGLPVRDVLLTAVVMTLARTGAGSLVVDLKDHGRRLLDREVDLSWTMGWFMNTYPVRLPLEAASPSDLLAEIGRRVTAVPDYGMGYSLLRYVTDQGRPNLTSPAPVSVNYIGNLGSGLPAGVRPVLDQIIVNPDGRVASRCPVQLSAGVIADQLRVEAFFSRNRFRVPTIDRLAQRMEAALRDLIDVWLPAGR